jgi:hypothetical protein
MEKNEAATTINNLKKKHIVLCKARLTPETRDLNMRYV